MQKIIAINSSKRKINTSGVIKQSKEILNNNNNIEVEIINLFDYDIKTCIGCENCLIKGDCIFKDDLADIMDAIKESDGVILTSPVYMENVSGMLKIFLILITQSLYYLCSIEMKFGLELLKLK